jgi:hypothetical protein
MTALGWDEQGRMVPAFGATDEDRSLDLGDYRVAKEASIMCDTFKMGDWNKCGLY